MTGDDKADNDSDDFNSFEEDLAESDRRRNAELAYLFGQESVEQVSQIDAADLSLNKDMTDCISLGVRQVKEQKNNPHAQKKLLEKMSPGERLVLCLWIMDMDLLDKIQMRSYLE